LLVGHAALDLAAAARCEGADEGGGEGAVRGGGEFVLEVESGFGVDEEVLFVGERGAVGAGAVDGIVLGEGGRGEVVEGGELAGGGDFEEAFSREVG
jgi:hypothetical protein